MTDSMINYNRRCQALLMCELRYDYSQRAWIGIYPWNANVKFDVSILNANVVSDRAFSNELQYCRLLKQENVKPRWKYIN